MVLITFILKVFDLYIGKEYYIAKKIYKLYKTSMYIF